MSAEQVFWFRISNLTIGSSNKPLVKVEVPSELPKVSLVNASLTKLNFHLRQFDSVVKEKKRIKPAARTEVEQAKAKQPLDNALDFACCPDYSLVSGLRMFKIYDREPLSAHGYFVRKFMRYRLRYQVRPLLQDLWESILRRREILSCISGKTLAFIVNLEASKTKSWLWHRRLSHLNFGTLNKLAKDGLARGIPRLKFQKDHLCSACALGKSKKSSHQTQKLDRTRPEETISFCLWICVARSVFVGELFNGEKAPLLSYNDMKTWLAKDGLARRHSSIPRLKFQKDHLCSACALGKSKKSSNQPKAKDTNQEKLYLLHMDLCGPMRVASFNRKMRVVRFLKTKDEAPEAIIKCIKNVQVHLNATVRNVQTDNGTGFVNQILREFMKMLASRIKHLLPAFLNRTALSKGEIELL
ncbi:retrovirus-related pol polyprotein from transposon TNT 1-94 [Tanacetum coccineum]